MTDGEPQIDRADQLVARDIACIRGGRFLFSGLGFSLSPGKGVLLSGPNGIGKSSLLRILAGLLPAAAGSVALPTDTGRIAYLGHDDGLKPLATVAESLVFWAAVNGPIEPTALRQGIEEAMETFALGTLAALPCRYLSAGQRRRVALGRIVATAAPLWLMDEPTTALDAAGAHAFEHALARHLAVGGMAVVATHAPIAVDGMDTLEIARFTGTGPGFTDPFTGGLSVERDP
jgi:heme exporter protein A